ncbi:MAG: rod shape-determining protein MreD [Nitrospiraceae bacterium]|nr:MAG: rod shape-determining protein MreD [Nitrospiraceae bacterium]
MNIFLVYIFFAYLALTLQAIFFKGIKPDFILVLVCFYSFKYGQAKGTAYGATAGLLMDAASGFIIGPNIISKSLSGFLTAVLRENIFQWNTTVNTIVIAILSVMDIFIVHVCYETFSKMSFHNRPWGIPVTGVIYTVIAALLLYPLFSRNNGAAFSGSKY